MLTQEGPSSPELAHYDTLARTGPQWRNLEGYYTRYGDVRELLEKIDDRIVIAKSGDELRCDFRAPPRRAGWTRDFVFIGDGWMKEGDYNFQFSKTVLPLPYHSMKTILHRLLPLEQDRAYRSPIRLAAVSYPLRHAGAFCASLVESGQPNGRR